MTQLQIEKRRKWFFIGMQTPQTDAGGQTITGVSLTSNSRPYLKLIALIMEGYYTPLRLMLQQ